MKRRYHNHLKGGGLFSAIEHQQTFTQRKTGILKLRGIIDWESFRPLLQSFADTLSERGLIPREGSLADASFIDVPRQRNSREENRQITAGKRPPKNSTNTPPQVDKKLRLSVPLPEFYTVAEFL